MIGEIYSPNSGDLIVQDGHYSVAKVGKNKSELNVPAVLGHLVQYANIASIAGSIKKGMQYVVQVPTHLQAAMESGKYTMLHGEGSGKTWATIVEKLPNGKNEFIANCPIKEEAFYSGNPMQDMSSSFANLQLQHQMAALAQMIGETYDAILRVESGQKADRIGQLNAGREGIIHALEMKDLESRKLAIVVARGILQEAQGKIGEVLKQKIFTFEPLPKGRFKRFLREFNHIGYLDKSDDEYNSICDYFDLYMLATKLIAESFIICDEQKSAESVFNTCIQFVEKLDFDKVRTILYSHTKKSVEDLFFHTAVSEIMADKALCLEATKQYDYLEIAVDGAEILEVLEHG